MRLWLPIPEAWPVLELPETPGRLVAVVPGHRDRPDLTVTIGPLEGLPDDPDVWVRSILQGNADGPVHVLHNRESRTELGWPVQLFHAVVSGPGEPAVREQRLAACYRFLDHAAAVLVRGSDAARFDAHREMLLEILSRARPDFHGDEPVALAELYEAL